MITFIAHVTVRSENRLAFEELMTRVRDLTRANESDVVYYDFGESADRRGTYVVIEAYRDATAHAFHMETAWVKDSLPESRRLIDGAFEVEQIVSPGSWPTARRMGDASSRTDRLP